MRRIAIVGMSLAGLRAAETLRRDGFDGRSSRSAPSRTCRTTGRRSRRNCSPGRAEPDDIVLRKQGVDDLELDWRLGRRATRLDARGPRRSSSTTASSSTSTG